MFITRALAATAATGLLLLSVIGSAGAAEDIDENDAPGPKGKISFFEHTAFMSYTGQVESRLSYDSNFKNDLFNDEASSYANKTDYYWLLYDDTGYRDRAVCARPHSFYPLSAAGFNDKMSSTQRMTKKQSTSCGSWAVIGIKFR